MFDVEEFVAGCRDALQESQPHLAVKELVARAISRPSEIEAALGTSARGGIEVLHRSPEFTILHVTWPPGVRLYPHEHRMWAANGIYVGREDNTFYRRVPEGIVVSGGRALEASDVVLLGDDAIHAVTNPRRSYTRAIHVYGGDYFAIPRSQWDPDTLVEAPFDVEQLKRLLAEADTTAHAEFGDSP